MQVARALSYINGKLQHKKCAASSPSETHRASEWSEMPQLQTKVIIFSSEYNPAKIPD